MSSFRSRPRCDLRTAEKLLSWMNGASVEEMARSVRWPVGTPWAVLAPVLERTVAPLLEWAADEGLWPWAVSGEEALPWLCKKCRGRAGDAAACAECGRTGIRTESPAFAEVFSLLVAGPTVLRRVRAVLKEVEDGYGTECPAVGCSSPYSADLWFRENRVENPSMSKIQRAISALGSDGVFLTPAYGTSFFWILNFQELAFRTEAVHDTIRIIFDVHADDVA